MNALRLTLVMALTLPGAAVAQGKAGTKTILIKDSGTKIWVNGLQQDLPLDEIAYEAVPVDGGAKYEFQTWDGVTGRIKKNDAYLPADAVKHYTKLIRRARNAAIADESLATLYKYRGIAWRALGSENSNHYDIAVADFDESLRLDPRQADVYTHRGYAHFLKGSATNETLASMRSIIRLIDSFIELGVRFDPAKTDYDKALDDFDRALRVNSESAWTLFCRADIRLEKWQGTWESLKSDLKEANMQLKKAEKVNSEKEEELKEQKADADQKNESLAQANKEFAQANQRFADAKENWTRANKDLSLANMLYFPQAERIFRRADVDLRKAKKKLNKARRHVAEASEDLDLANKDLEKANNDLTKAKAAVTTANNNSDLARRQFDVAHTDLKAAIADFNEALRAHPGASAVSTNRDRAVTLFEEAQILSKKSGAE